MAILTCHLKNSQMWLKVSNSDAITKSYADQKVAKSGDTMSGDLNIGSQKITNIAEGTASSDTITKSYADQKVAKSGDTMLGDLNMCSQNITNIANPTRREQDSISYKFFEDNFFHSRYGAIDVNGKKIFNIGVNTNRDQVINRGCVDDRFLNLAGNVAMNGDLQMGNHKIIALANPTTNTDAANKTFVDSNFLKLTGGTMSGNLQMRNNQITGLNDPSANDHTVYQKFVKDNYLSIHRNNQMEHSLDMNDNQIIGLPNDVNKQYVNNAVTKGNIKASHSSKTCLRISWMMLMNGLQNLVLML